MKEIVYRVLSYIIEYMKLMPVSFIFFGLPAVSGRSVICISVVITFLVGVCSALGGIFISTPFIALLLILNAVLMLEQKKDFVAILIIYIYICILDMIINGFLMYLLHINVELLSQYSVRYLLLNSPMLIVSLVMTLIKLRKRDKRPYKVPKKYLVLISVSAVTIIFYLTSVQLWAFNEGADKRSKLTAVSLGVTSILFLFIISLMIVKAIQNESLKRENRISNKLITAWEKYYTSILKNEKAVRAFRHDIRSHLLAIKHLCDSGSTSDINEYVDKMLDNINNTSRKIDTGNSLINALLSDLASGYPQVCLSVKGHIPDELTISSYDLCTMFYNMFSNAFEAADGCETKQVETIFEILEATLVTVVENTSEKAPAVNSDGYISSKSGEGHGYGISNIIRCTEENGGNFSLRFNDGKVRSVLTLPGAISDLN